MKFKPIEKLLHARYVIFCLGELHTVMCLFITYMSVRTKGIMVGPKYAHTHVILYCTRPYCAFFNNILESNNNREEKDTYGFNIL